jgi:hypothetical protein
MPLHRIFIYVYPVYDAFAEKMQSGTEFQERLEGGREREREKREREREVSE